MTTKRMAATKWLLWIALWLSTCAFTLSAQALTFPRESMIQRMERINENGRKTGQTVSFERRALEGLQARPFEARTDNMEEWLYYSLEGTELTYQKTSARDYIIIPREPVVVEEPEDEAAQMGTVTGKVLDDTGEPLPGATVKAIGRLTKGTATGLKGDFSLALPAGTYTIEVAYVGFDTHKTTGVTIREGETTPLSIVLNSSSTLLGEVVVTAGYDKSNTAGALRIQQNMAQISTVMAADQIGKTSDKNLGEALKRVTGVNTISNKYVSVRGMGERWNEAALDGVTLPSTEANSKAFSFDLIPTALVENITVIKTPTPDMESNFAGGLVQVTTKDIPEKNFISLQAGYSYNSLSTGKEQISRRRGKYDWLGFDDGGRALPEGIRFIPVDIQDPDPAIFEQSKKFVNDNFTLYGSKTPLSQNYQFSIGRTYAINEQQGDRFGFIASLSYRNTQQQNHIIHTERGMWMSEVKFEDGKPVGIDENLQNPGKVYRYNTTLGGILNMGYQQGNHRIAFRNTYTRKFDNDFTEIIGRDGYNGEPTDIPFKQQTNYPIFQTLYQNKMEGEHLWGKTRLRWDVAHTAIRRDQKDVTFTQEIGKEIDGEIFYSRLLDWYTNNQKPGIFPMSRAFYLNSERDWNWGLSAEHPFTIGGQFHTRAKVGYSGANMRNRFEFTEAARLVIDSKDAKNMPDGGHIWYIRETEEHKNAYLGKVNRHALYAMMDHRYSSWLRLVWGARLENYVYSELENPILTGGDALAPGYYQGGDDKKWRLLPSASLTITPVENFNIRLSYNQSVIRPQFMERTAYRFWDPFLGGSTLNAKVLSTTVNGTDLRLEWYPGVGEVVAVGYFYRHLDKPIERIMTIQGSGARFYHLMNSNWAKNSGFEFELRKNFAFIYDTPILRHLYLTANATFTRSTVEGVNVLLKDVEGEQVIERVPVELKRPLYGQVPYMYNIGLSYEGEQLGLNLAFNRTGRKLIIVARSENNTEYEAPHSTLDAQISYAIPRIGLSFKLNGSNLLNSTSLYYKNLDPEGDPNYNGDADRRVYISRSGRSFSCSATWTF